MSASSLLLTVSLLSACASPPQPAENAYLDYSGRDDVLSGGLKMVEIDTPRGELHVWTKRIGNSPTKKVLLLHGGPGATHEYWEAVDSYFPAAEIEYYYYDQLGSFYSDQPSDPDLWDIDRFPPDRSFSGNQPAGVGTYRQQLQVGARGPSFRLDARPGLPRGVGTLRRRCVVWLSRLDRRPDLSPGGLWAVSSGVL